MHINHVYLLTRDLDAQQVFYADLLGFNVIRRNPGKMLLSAGRTTLIFVPAPDGWQGAYHIAFDIPENRFDEAKAWLAERVPLVRDENGQEAFDFKNWNAHSVYFYDPAGNIVEFIARHSQPTATDTPFDASQIVSVSEVGIPTNDVQAMVSELQSATSVPVYDGEGSDTFTAVGDEDGLLIVVKTGREWYPNTGIIAKPTEVLAAVTTPQGQFKLHGLPYQIERIEDED